MKPQPSFSKYQICEICHHRLEKFRHVIRKEFGLRCRKCMDKANRERAKIKKELQKVDITRLTRL